MNSSEKLLKQRFENKKAVLLGAGVSNKPLAGFLRSLGASVEIRDKKTEEQLSEDASFYRSLGVRLVLGERYLENLDGDFIFRSPGFRPDMPALREAALRGSVITSEMETFIEVTPAYTVGVTGSDGKSTTTTVTSEILKRALGEDDVFLGGNIGFPLLHRVGLMNERSVAAIELSSFQLMSISNPVDVAVITNISPNHLNWHTDMNEYIDAKAKILDGARRAVLNIGNDVTRELGKRCCCPVVYFSAAPHSPSEISSKDSLITLEGKEIVKYSGGERRFIMTTDDILLPGRHNIENYMAAYAAASDFASEEDLREVARSFGGVRHRLELIRVLDGVYYYNSSIDSSPTRTAAALSAITDKPINIICGGYDKKIPFEPLASAFAACKNLKSVTLTGATADKISDAIKACPDFDSDRVRVEKVAGFRDAVLSAAEKAERGDAVLLSPACASFDAFSNFEERGDFFRKTVNELQ